jgi:hypothetical protein
VTSQRPAGRRKSWEDLRKTIAKNVLPLNSDFVGELKGLGWERFFIKDYAKSIKTSRGSVISRPEDINTVLSEMKEFRV